MSTDDSKKDDGLDKLISKLRELYGVSNEQATFIAYEKTFQQTTGMNIHVNDYINEFEQLNQNLSLWLVSTTALSNNWTIDSMDIKSAFLQGFPIECVVYVILPQEANTSNL